MKDSNENRNDANGHDKGQGWDDPAFSWENMQDGIFEKIVEEDPDFFKEKRRRRLLIWFWFCAAILAGGGLYYSINNGSKQAAPPTPNQFDKPIIASQNDQQVPTNKIAVEENRQEKKTSAENIESQPSIAKSQAKSNRSIGVKQQEQSAVSTQNQATLTPANHADNQVVAEQKTSTTIERLSQTEPKQGAEVSKLRMIELRPFLVPLEIPTVQTKPLPVIEAQKVKEQRTWAFAANGGSLVSFSKYAGSSGAVTLRNGHTSPWFGYQYGIGIGAPVSKRGQVFLHLNRQVAYQNIDIYTERRVQKEVPNTLLAVDRFVVGNRWVGTYGDTIVGATEKNRLVHYNEQKSDQAQLGYAWSMARKNWHFNLNSGFAFGYMTKQAGFTVAADGVIFEFNNSKPIYQRIQLAPFAGVGIERDLGKRFAINMNYLFQKQVNNASLESDLRFNPAFHSLSLGVRLKLTKP